MCTAEEEARCRRPEQPGPPFIKSKYGPPRELANQIHQEERADQEIRETCTQEGWQSWGGIMPVTSQPEAASEDAVCTRAGSARWTNEDICQV